MDGGCAVRDTQASQQEEGAAVAELQAAFADLAEQMDRLQRSNDHTARHARCHVRILTCFVSLSEPHMLC